MADSRHRSVPERPRKIWIPCRKGSVFLCFRCTLSSVGFVWQSTAIPCGVKCCSGSNDESLGIENSPAQRKPKNPSINAAHNMCRSIELGWFDQWPFVFRRRSGVMGSLSLLGEAGQSACDLVMPFRTYSSLGHGCPLNGSGKPAEICRCWIAETDFY